MEPSTRRRSSRSKPEQETRHRRLRRGWLSRPVVIDARRRQSLRLPFESRRSAGVLPAGIGLLERPALARSPSRTSISTATWTDAGSRGPAKHLDHSKPPHVTGILLKRPNTCWLARSTTGLIVRDLNGDGRVDLAMGVHDASSLQCLGGSPLFSIATPMDRRRLRPHRRHQP